MLPIMTSQNSISSKQAAPVKVEIPTQESSEPVASTIDIGTK
jgi:hypothetical protein